MYGGLFHSFPCTCYLILSRGALYLSLYDFVCPIGLKPSHEAVSYKHSFGIDALTMLDGHSVLHFWRQL